MRIVSVDKASRSPLSSSLDQGQLASGREEGEAWQVGITTMWACTIKAVGFLFVCLFLCIDVIQYPWGPEEGARFPWDLSYRQL